MISEILYRGRFIRRRVRRVVLMDLDRRCQRIVHHRLQFQFQDIFDRGTSPLLRVALGK